MSAFHFTEKIKKTGEHIFRWQSNTMRLQLSEPFVTACDGGATAETTDDILYFYYTVKLQKRMTARKTGKKTWKTVAKRHVHDFPAILSLQESLSEFLAEDGNRREKTSTEGKREGNSKAQGQNSQPMPNNAQASVEGGEKRIGTHADGYREKDLEDGIKVREYDERTEVIRPGSDEAEWAHKKRTMECGGVSVVNDDYYTLTKHIIANEHDVQTYYAFFAGTSYDPQGYKEIEGIYVMCISEEDVKELKKMVDAFVAYAIS